MSSVENNPSSRISIARSGATDILVVDGNPQAVGTIRQALEKTDEYTVIVARDGPECMQQAAEKPPDLILLDIHVPGEDEMELLRQLRSRSDTSSIPILIVSVDTDLERMAACFEAGADGFLIKPFDAAVLCRRVRSAIARHKARSIPRYAW